LIYVCMMVRWIQSYRVYDARAQRSVIKGLRITLVFDIRVDSGVP